jgi:hypothetical protein
MLVVKYLKPIEDEAMKVSTSIWLGVGFLIALAACKPSVPKDGGSEIRTLDNFAAGSQITINSCKGMYTEDKLDPVVRKMIADFNLIAAPADLRPEVDHSLSAIPTGLKNLFFLAGYRIDVAKGNTAKCTDVLPASSQACGKPEIVKNSNGDVREGIVIYVEAEKQAVRHALVRAFAYTMSERLARLIPADSGGFEIGEHDDAGFSEWKAQAVVAVLHDVATRQGIDDKTFGVHRSKLPTDGKLLAKSSSLNERRAEWAEFAKKNVQNAHDFSSYALAEAADSYWCDPAVTRISMKRDFPETHQLFEAELDAALSADRLTEMSAEAEDASSAALGLTARRYRFPILGAPFRAAGRIASAPFRARANLVGRVGSFPRLRTGRLFPRAYGF